MLLTLIVVLLLAWMVFALVINVGGITIQLLLLGAAFVLFIRLLRGKK